jgi:hypothetical protein
MVLELPPAPAALVLVGLALATLSALSAAAFLLIAVFGPPGGDKFRPLLTPAEAGGDIGEDGRGEDCKLEVSATKAPIHNGIKVGTIVEENTVATSAQDCRLIRDMRHRETLLIWGCLKVLKIELETYHCDKGVRSALLEDPPGNMGCYLEVSG